MYKLCITKYVNYAKYNPLTVKFFSVSAHSSQPVLILERTFSLLHQM